MCNCRVVDEVMTSRPTFSIYICLFQTDFFIQILNLTRSPYLDEDIAGAHIHTGITTCNIEDHNKSGH